MFIGTHNIGSTVQNVDEMDDSSSSSFNPGGSTPSHSTPSSSTPSCSTPRSSTPSGSLAGIL